MAEQYKIIHPVKYYRDFINYKIRPDGREFNQFRPVQINVNSINTADGSAIVKLGNTTVVCGIKAELTEPNVAEPEYGFVQPNIELTALCSPRFRPGVSNDEAQVLSCAINGLLTNSKWIDLKDLCIEKEKLVWVLFCDISCLDYDGSILDAAVIALVAALRSLSLPEVKYNFETSSYSVNETNRKSLSLSNLAPVATTSMVFEQKHILTDPDSEEEDLAATLVTIGACNGEICMVNKPGGSAIAEEQMYACMKHALSREKSVCALISSVLEKKI